MFRPLVSVIIPLYNSENYISNTIQSVIDQTYENIEIIIIDDGSTDNSAIIAKAFVDERIKVFSQKNMGASSARNHGLREAKGDFIQFLDADDWMDNNKIDCQVEILSKNPTSMVGCNWVRIEPKTRKTIGGLGPDKTIAKDLRPLDWLVEGHMMLIHCWLTPRKLIESGGCWNEELNYNDDGEFFYRIISNCSKVLFTNKTCVYYSTSLNNHNISNLKINKSTKLYSAYEAAITYRDSLYSLGYTPESRLAFSKALHNIYQHSFLYDREISRKCKAHEEFSLIKFSLRKKLRNIKCIALRRLTIKNIF